MQDLMLQNAKQLWAWIEDGAYIYVCGDATRMAKDVNRVLDTIVQEQGCMSKESSENYMQMLSDNSRYQRDVYS